MPTRQIALALSFVCLSWGAALPALAADEIKKTEQIPQPNAQGSGMVQTAVQQAQTVQDMAQNNPVQAAQAEAAPAKKGPDEVDTLPDGAHIDHYKDGKGREIREEIYNAAGKLVRTITWMFNDATVPPSVTETTTDGKGRLVSEYVYEKSPGGDYDKVRFKHTIEYYENGNKKHEETHTYEKSGLDTGDYHSFTKEDWNDKGQPTQRITHSEGDVPGVGAVTSETKITWTYAGDKLSKITVTENGVVTSERIHNYNADGKLQSIEYWELKDGVLIKVRTEIFLYDGGGMLTIIQTIYFGEDAPATHFDLVDKDGHIIPTAPPPVIAADPLPAPMPGPMPGPMAVPMPAPMAPAPVPAPAPAPAPNPAPAPGTGSTASTSTSTKTTVSTSTYRI